MAYTFKDLLKEKPFSKITINDISNRCDINRQTFYYHFQDIRDLVEWICISEVDNLLDKKEEYEKWEDKFLLIFNIMKEEKVFVRSNLYRLVYPIIYSEIVEKSKGKNLREEDKKFITDFYKYAFVSIVLDWIDKGMYEDANLIVSKLVI